jgi:hypothetical protein
LAHVLGVVGSIREHLKVRAGGQGWSDVQVVLAIILLNIAGGDCVEDLERLEADQGFSALLRRAELHHLPRVQRRELERRWRKERKRAVPSPSAVLRYLEAFHDVEQEVLREPGTDFIPEPNEHLLALRRVQKAFLAFVQARSPQETATFDVDATITPSYKADALPTYKGGKGYQPLNVWWGEQGMVLHSEFRDGNVPAGFEILRVVQEALEILPESVREVAIRSDTAGYQNDFMKWLADAEKHPRFGAIPFAIGCPVSPEFRRAALAVPEERWHREYRDEKGYRVPTPREWAEVCFVPRGLGFAKKTMPFRFLATRELLEQQQLPGVDQQPLPFPTATWADRHYAVFGIVTNREEKDGWTGEKVIQWLYQRCGDSEHAHSVMKEDLAGGKLPCAEFGKNAAWWAMMILALNLNVAMKRLVLQDGWVTRRMKAIRFHLVHIAGRLLDGGRQLKLRVGCGTHMLEVIIRARNRIMALAVSPPN